MAVSLMQVGRTGAVPGSKANVVSGGTPVTEYDTSVTDQDHTLGGDAILLADATELIGICDAAAAGAQTGFRWAIVTTAGAALPANSPRWLPDQGRDWWGTKPTPGVARYFKTAALS